MADWEPESMEIPLEIQELAEARVAARAEKNWSEADRIRDMVLEKGFKIVDEAGTYSIVKA
jgi:cysteinyl-tRNA synthetase